MTDSIRGQTPIESTIHNPTIVNESAFRNPQSAMSLNRDRSLQRPILIVDVIVEAADAGGVQIA